MEHSDLLQRFADNPHNIYVVDGLSFYRDSINHIRYFIFDGDEDDLWRLDDVIGYVNIRGVIVLSSVEDIQTNAFLGFSNLRTVEFQQPSKVRTIGKSAFQNCIYLDKIDLSSVEYVMDDAFHGCCHLSDITFGPRLLGIGKDAFHSCSHLTSVIIPRIRVIDDSAFRRCLSLESVELPEEVPVIAEHAFAGCRSLSNLVIPYVCSGDILSSDAFYGCNQISQVDMRFTDKVVPYIGTEIYEKFIRLTNVFRATHRDKTTALKRLKSAMRHRLYEYITSHYRLMDVAVFEISRIVLGLTSSYDSLHHIDEDVVSTQLDEDFSIANIVSQQVMSFIKLPETLNIIAHGVQVEYNYNKTIGEFIRGAIDAGSSSSSF